MLVSDLYFTIKNGGLVSGIFLHSIKEKLYTKIFPWYDEIHRR